MKKWIAIAVILMCCLVYAIVKLSMSENQNVNSTTEEKQSVKQINAGNVVKTTPAESTQQINADNTDKTSPKEGSGSPVTAVQVEAATKVFSEFQSAIKSEDYEQAWKLTSEFFKDSMSDGSFEEFKKFMAGEGAVLVTATVHPESAIDIEGHVGLLVTVPSSEHDMYFLFFQEDGQWKLHSARSAQSVDSSKE